MLGFYGTVLWTTADETVFDRGDDTELAHSYGSIRRCIKHLRQLEGEVYTTIEGRDIEAGEERTLSGRVLRQPLTKDEGIALFVVENGEKGEIQVGGLVAAHRDVEAHEVGLFREPPSS